MDEKELELYRFMKVALESGATIKMTEKGKGGLFVRGRKLTDKDLLECITNPKPKTKADYIRAMSDEELADWLKSIRYSCTCLPRGNGNRCADFKDDCKACWLNWLEQEDE